MAYFHPAWIEAQRQRWTRCNAHLWWKPGVANPLKPPASPARKPLAASRAEADLVAEITDLRAFTQLVADIRHDLTQLRLLRRTALARKYSPDQPRVPAGNADGGQWTNGGGGEPKINDPRVLSDATPDDAWKPGAQYAQGPRVPRTGSARQFPEAGPGRLAEYDATRAQARAAIDRVHQLDPSWQPTPSAYQSIDGAIDANKADAAQAEARLADLARNGIGPGPYAAESIPARGPGRDFTADERRQINRIGGETGCHTCGTVEPGTRSGNFVPDHQPPNALNQSGRPQRLYPQCIACSASQGGWLGSNRRR